MPCLQQTATVSIHNVSRLVFTMDILSVYCAVWTQLLMFVSWYSLYEGSIHCYIKCYQSKEIDCYYSRYKVRGFNLWRCEHACKMRLAEGSSKLTSGSRSVIKWNVFAVTRDRFMSNERAWRHAALAVRDLGSSGCSVAYRRFVITIVKSQAVLLDPFRWDWYVITECT
jgi:hypothetical protein